MFSWLRRRSEPDPEPIRQRMDAVESKIRQLELEWTDAHEKIMHALDRTRKRGKATEIAEQPELAPSDATLSDTQLYNLARQKGLIR